MALHAVIGTSTFHVGDTIDVHYKIVEQEKVAGKTKRSSKVEKKERIQVFGGIVIAIGGTGNGKNFVVRKIGSAGIGVERIFPVISPWIAKVTVKRLGSVRRSKLYFMREYTGKDATHVKEKKVHVAKPKKKKATVAKKTAKKVAVKSTKPAMKNEKKQPAKGTTGRKPRSKASTV